MSVHSPLLWRELARGMSNCADVEAAQRGLWRAADDLGYTSTNARNGNYGSETASDVGKFRRAVKLTGPSDRIGSKLWPLIWPYIDDLGRQLFCNQPEACPSPRPKAKKLPIVYGDNSKGVEAVQRALWRALPTSVNVRNGKYGDGTAKDVEAFRKLYVVNAGDDGKSIGGELYYVLTRWFDAYAVSCVAQWDPEQEPPPEPPVSEIMGLTVKTALGQEGYQEGRGNANKYGEWYGMNYASWCAMFVTWCAEQNRSNTFHRAQRYAFCPYVVADAMFGRHGLHAIPAAMAKRGSICLFDWNNDGYADHIGLITVGPGRGQSFHTIEGNTSSNMRGPQANGDGVYQRTRYVPNVICFATFE